MKRLYVVIVPAVPNAFKVSCPDVFKRIFIISVGSRENKNIAEFLYSRTSLFFGYARHIQRQVPFFVINLCKLFFFNRVKSAFKLGFNGGGIPMKRFYAVIVSTVLNAFEVSRPDVFGNSRPFALKRGQRKNVAQFLGAGASFLFGYVGTEHLVPFGMMPFKELLFFKRLVSVHQFHISNHRTNFRKVNHLNSEGCYA